jgi:hypothetical protein
MRECTDENLLKDLDPQIGDLLEQFRARTIQHPAKKLGASHPIG